MNKAAFLLLALVFLLTSFYVDYANADMNAANPQAASFANVDKGSSGSGGDLILPIQLFNVPGLGGLDIPVNIIYSSSDNTLRKDSTDVGFGFSLGASSAITRSVNGVPDEYIHVNDRIDSDCNGNTVNVEETGWLFDRPGGYGSKYSEKDIPGVNICPSAVDCRPNPSNDCLAISGCYWDTFDGLCKNSNSNNKLYDYIKGVNRGNPDNFYISVNGEGSGMMLNSNRQFIFGNVKPWKISYSYDAGGVNGISEFVVTVQDGTRYIFKDLVINTRTTQTICDNDPELITSTDEQIKFLNYACSIRNLVISPANKPYTYSWPLAYIESADYVDSDSIPGPSQNDKGSWVKFDYETGPTITIENSPSYLYSSSVFYGNEGSHLFKQARITSSSTIVDYRLIKITTPLYEVNLDYSPTRGIYDSVRPGLKRLNFISLKQNPGVPGASQELLKKVAFDYYTDSSRINGKLTLRQIKEYGISESASLPPTKFEYKNIPCSAENKYGLCANDPTDFLISTITYPTGGNVKYVFQPDNVYYLQDVQEIGTLRCLQDNIGTVPFWSTCPANFNPFNGLGTRLSRIEADDGSGEITSTYYQYGMGVIESDPFCRKIKTTATQYWPSEFIGCKGSVSAGYSYSESDIGRSNVNKVAYTSVATRIIGKSGGSDSGAMVDYYITARDYPSACSGNGNCITSFDYQYGRPIRTRLSKSDYTLFRETFYSYNLDGNDLKMDDVSYSDWFNTWSKHIYKVPLLDWDHLDEEKGIPIPYARVVPDTFTGKDAYAYSSSGNFLMRQQEVEYSAGSSVPNIISSKAFSYYSAGNDIPDSSYGSSFNPGNIYSYSNFNGMPKKVIEYLLYKNCYAYTLPSLPALGMLGSVSYYSCIPIKAREINYNFAFQNQPGLFLQKNMKGQEGSVTLMETSYDSYGMASSRKPLSYTDTIWLTFNNDQVYPAAKKTWLDKNKNQQIDPENIYPPDNEYVYVNFDQYDTHGNLLKYTDPIGTEYHTTYYLNKYPEKIWNEFLGSSANPIQKSTYDESGNIKAITEINQKTTSYNYDALGRLTEVIKPYDLLPSQKISYCYALDSNPNCDNSFPNLNYVSTTNVLNDLVSVESRSFSDGLGKIKQAAVIESPSSTIRMNNEYYENGKLKKSYKPVRDQGTVSSGTLKFKPYGVLTPQGSQTKQLINTGYVIYDFNTKNKIATENNNFGY
ncbi:MAG: RHS repeat domain-containing protein, partial [Nanoarchaeota archaeon]